MQPFGKPVLPDVNCMLISVSTVGNGTAGAVSGAASTIRCQLCAYFASAAPCTMRFDGGTSASRFVISANTDRQFSSMTRNFASLSCSTYSSSRGLYWVLTGTMTAPSRASAIHVTTYAGTLGSMTATWVPGATPSACSAFAHFSVARANSRNDMRLASSTDTHSGWSPKRAAAPSTSAGRLA